jgi:RNA polymerase sigma factor (TIGR02999 family)
VIDRLPIPLRHLPIVREALQPGTQRMSLPFGQRPMKSCDCFVAHRGAPDLDPTEQLDRRQAVQPRIRHVRTDDVQGPRLHGVHHQVEIKELRKLVAQKLAGEQPGQTLQATALVHDVYLRMVGNDVARVWNGRGDFFAAAATAMWHILVERARQKGRQIHGGGRRREELHPDIIAAPVPDEDLLALDAALAKFAARDPLKARLVELRFFAGLTCDQAAEILGISPSNADRHWVFARAWLRREVKAGNAIEEN